MKNTTLATFVLSLACSCTPAPAETASADRKDALGILCESQVRLAGHLEASTPRPSDVSGCWPVGTWTFAATVESSDCAAPPALDPEYSLSVSRDADHVESYLLRDAPGRGAVKVKVSSGGGGLCEGGLQIYSPDGKTLINLKPTLHADGSVTGHGEVERYATAQF
jgi:hypothetical protein